MAVEKIKSERVLKALKPGAGRINDGGGLYLVPFAWQESHYWRLDYTHQGRRRTMSLGAYPEIGLDSARSLAREARDKLLSGVDPMDDRQEARENPIATSTTASLPAQNASKPPLSANVMADRTASAVAGQQQRFNVALSRARDRMYLFRSVADNAFSEDSLSGKVLRHFRQPFNQDTRQVEQLRDLCESGFERDMFDEITMRGYRIQPQVPCGSYRIDFVIEGNEGRRLAVECDGDRFHGPGQWSDDMARQRVLERAGWTFWRCFASSFARRRTEVLNDLWSTLEGLGIEPLGADSIDNTAWVEMRNADPFGVEASEPESEEVETQA